MKKILLFVYIVSCTNLLLGQTADKITVPDTRNTNEPPTSYDQEVRFEFKNGGVIGTNGSGTYAGLLTFAPWKDNSGGNHHQLGFQGNEIFYRTGQPSNTTWGSWNKILTEVNGNVGIGIATPENHDNWNRVLNVYGTSHSKITTSTSNVNTGIWSHNIGYYGAPAGGILGTYSNHPVSFITNKSTKMTILSSGEIGIGTTNPSEKLTVIGNIYIPAHNYSVQYGHWNHVGSAASDYGYIGMCLRYKNDRWESFHQSIDGMAMKFIANGIDFITAPKATNNATIRTFIRFKNDGSLTAEGKITSKEVEVKQNVWSDFVFYDTYNLKTLEQVETYIKANGHLPDVPSEKEVKENGLNLGESDAVLLQKIEELTLYAIEQNKKLKEQQSEIAKLKAENQTLKEMQSAIEDIQKQLEGLKK